MLQVEWPKLLMSNKGYERMLKIVQIYKSRDIKAIQWIFYGDSAIWRACEALELGEVRRLFTSGEASLFMEDEYGNSLPQKIFWRLACGPKPIPLTGDAVRLFELLVKASGRTGVCFTPEGLWSVLTTHCRPNRTTRESTENVVSIIRLIIESS
jgi:hypothetical protein